MCTVRSHVKLLHQENCECAVLNARTLRLFCQRLVADNMVIPMCYIQQCSFHTFMKIVLAHLTQQYMEENTGGSIKIF